MDAILAVDFFSRRFLKLLWTGQLTLLNEFPNSRRYGEICYSFPQKCDDELRRIQSTVEKGETTTAMFAFDVLIQGISAQATDNNSSLNHCTTTKLRIVLNSTGVDIKSKLRNLCIKANATKQKEMALFCFCWGMHFFPLSICLCPFHYLRLSMSIIYF